MAYNGHVIANLSKKNMLYYGHDASIKSGEIMSENLIHTLLSDMLQDRDQKTARLQQANIELQTFQALSGAIRKYLIEVAEAIQGEPEDSKRLNIYAKAINDLAAFTRNEPARMAKNLEMGRVEINTYNSLIEKIHQIQNPEESTGADIDTDVPNDLADE